MSAGALAPKDTPDDLLATPSSPETPCNSDGFGFDKDGHCMSPRWAACLGDAKSNNCLWYSADDDCAYATVVTGAMS